MGRPTALGLVGGSKTAPPATGVTAALAGTAGQCNLSWTLPGASTYDTISVSRQIDGGGYSVIATPTKGTTSIANDVAGFSNDVQYQVTLGRTGGFPSTPATSNTVRTPPGAPTINSWVPTNPGTLTLTATGPTQSKIAGYDVQLSTNNGSTYGGVVDSGADPNHVFSGTGNALQCVVQVRTRDTLGQVSAFATSSAVTSINDVTGPTIPSAPTPAWNQGIPGFTITNPSTITDASGVSSVVIDISYDGGSTIGSSTGIGATAGSTCNIAIADAQRGVLCYIRTRATDVYGNVSATAWSGGFYSKPKGAAFASPTASVSYSTNGTWSGAPGWEGALSDLLNSGTADSFLGLQYGAWFYGTNIQDQCKGYVPDSASIVMVRNGASGFSGNNNIQQHANTSQPAGATGLTFVGSADTGPNLTGTNASANYTLPAGWLANMLSGAMRGVAVVNSGSYRSLQGIAENGFSGVITLNFT